MESLRVSAPGRVCLFGEHQDYLGLPVIAAAVSLRISIEGEPESDGLLHVEMPDIGRSLAMDPALEQFYEAPRDYIRSAVNNLKRRGFRWPAGWKTTVHGDIPINAGLSSSSALVVAWLAFLIRAGQGPEISAEDLARLGYQAEVAEFHEPGGMMDHYCAALGGLLAIDTVSPFAAERLPMLLEGIVLGNSQQPKATLQTLGRIRADVTEGIRQISQRMPGFDLATTPLDEADSGLSAIEPEPARRLRANLLNRDITRAARAAIGGGDYAEIGRLLLAHHAQLRDGLDLSTEKIEGMLAAAMEAGALGGKINGSGGGGCMFVLAPGHEEAVAEAIRSAGGVPYIVRVDKGAG